MRSCFYPSKSGGEDNGHDFLSLSSLVRAGWVPSVVGWSPILPAASEGVGEQQYGAKPVDGEVALRNLAKLYAQHPSYALREFLHDECRRQDCWYYQDPLGNDLVGTEIALRGAQGEVSLMPTNEDSELKSNKGGNHTAKMRIRPGAIHSLLRNTASGEVGSIAVDEPITSVAVVQTGTFAAEGAVPVRSVENTSLSLDALNGIMPSFGDTGAGYHSLRSDDVQSNDGIAQDHSDLREVIARRFITSKSPLSVQSDSSSSTSSYASSKNVAGAAVWGGVSALSTRLDQGDELSSKASSSLSSECSLGSVGTGMAVLLSGSSGRPRLAHSGGGGRAPLNYAGTVCTEGACVESPPLPRMVHTHTTRRDSPATPCEGEGGDCYTLQDLSTYYSNRGIPFLSESPANCLIPSPLYALPAELDRIASLLGRECFVNPLTHQHELTTFALAKLPEDPAKRCQNCCRDGMSRRRCRSNRDGAMPQTISRSHRGKMCAAPPAGLVVRARTLDEILHLGFQQLHSGQRSALGRDTGGGEATNQFAPCCESDRGSNTSSASGDSYEFTRVAYDKYNFLDFSAL